MKWLRSHSIEWGVDYQIAIDDAELHHGHSHESIGDEPFADIPIMPRNLSEWSVELLVQRSEEAAAAASEVEMKSKGSAQYQDQKDPAKGGKGSKGVKPTRAAKGRSGKK